MDDEAAPRGYSAQDRIAGAVLCGVFVVLAVIMADIACNGAMAARFSGSPAGEAERYAREAAK